MRNGFLLCLLLFPTVTSLAQKKLIPVTQSALTGISLPVGSQQDNRFLSVTAANVLMSEESKKSGKEVSKTEVLVLPPSASSGFDANTLVQKLLDMGWNITVCADDENYAWLQKDSQSVLMYFSTNTNGSDLYFALDASSPQFNNSSDVKNENAGNSQMQPAAVASVIYIPVEFYDQKETFDLATYSVPKDWKREANENVTSYSIVNNQDLSWCKIGIVKSTISKGSIGEDLSSEWTELAAKPYNITDPPHTSEASESDGWQTKTGSGQFIFNNNKAAVILTTFSGYGRCVSIIATTGNQRYLDDIESFISHIELQIPDRQTLAPEVASKVPSQQISTNDFTFTTSNFDDGWVATAEDDWVRVNKGKTIVLVHYPNKQADEYNPDLLEGLKNAWNVLVAPRYSSGANFEFKPIHNWESIEFAEADLVEKTSGKQVHVVLFKKNYTGGSGKFLEFISPTKADFERDFGPYHETSYGWENLENMATYNKFAVAATDLQGKWSSNFSGTTQYVNAATGYDAGMDTHASVENFQFNPGSTYHWDLSVANGFVGNIKFDNVKSDGDFSMNGNWQINFSDIEGKPRTFDAHFSCIKDLRVLWLDDKAFFKVQ